ncbi:MAG TPA: aldo/keto reductase [Thermoanaerobaculia bacterium]|nr:aldo/keto reductase [Thermoanaerobaculia bacterium]
MRRSGRRSPGHAAGSGVSRRMFLELSVAGAVVAGAARLGVTQETRANGIPYRTLGRTGEKVSLVGVGGAHLGWMHDEQEAIRIVRTALDSGINFMDNSWDYSDGKSEERMGKALRDGYRQRAFLMTKIDGRTRQSAAQQLDESLRRLQTDHLDLLQFHEIIRMTDADRIFAPGGALEAALAAKQAGKVRYLGFTGHKSPDIHLHMLETAAAHQFTFDTVQMPINVMDAHYHSFADQVLPVALGRHMGVLAMKTMGDHHILDSKAVSPVECLCYAMNLPVSVVITGCDSLAILRQAIDAAKDFRPLSDSQLAALRGKTARAAEAGRYELYKTSDQFDSTGHHPEWLG